MDRAEREGISRWCGCRRSRTRGRALSLTAHGRLEQLEAPGVRVEARAGTDRKGPLIVHVADREAHRDGHTERLEIVRQDPVESHGPVGAAPAHLGELSDGHARDAIERAGEAQVREHPVDPVDRFTHILEEEDRSAEVRHEAGAEEALDQAEVAAHESPFGGTRDEADDAMVARDEHRLREWQCLEDAGRVGLHEDALEVGAREGGEPVPRHGSVERRDIGRPVQGKEKRRDVREADDRLRMTAKCREIDLIENASDAVPATNAPHGIDVGAPQRVVEIRDALGIGAGEVAVMRVGEPAEVRLTPEGTDELLGTAQVVALEERSGRRNERDTCTWHQHPGELHRFDPVGPRVYSFRVPATWSTAVRASQPALLAAGRVIAETRDEMVAEWLDRLGDRVAAAPTIPRPTVEREFRLIIEVLSEMVGPLRREVRTVWQDVCRHYGRVASARGLAAGEVVEELLHLRDLLTRQLAPVLAAMRARQGMAIMLRLNRVLDHGVAVAVIGYTDALVASLIGRDGAPYTSSEVDPDEVERQLDAFEAALAAVSRRS